MINLSLGIPIMALFTGALLIHRFARKGWHTPRYLDILANLYL